MHRTLITVEELQALQRSGRPLKVFDCSFDLMAPQSGRAQFEQGHIPGAIHADLDTALSARHGASDRHGSSGSDGGQAPSSGGRHPLPSRGQFEEWLRSVGFSNDMQAVVYDRQGCLFCGRLWWMLQWMGHEAVAVLDGGLPAWQAAGGALATDSAMESSRGTFSQSQPRVRLVSVQEVEAGLSQGTQTLVDARAPARYRGEVEPLDPVAGHIPGALNRPYGLNLGPDGHFKPAAELRQEFEALLAGRDAASVVHQCGSGVSAVPNLLAMQIAGLGPTGLFAGSWSEWCSDPDRPVARG
jgi:thiosulfate/3-mercaptopyruvate sulfurtransferase